MLRAKSALIAARSALPRFAAIAPTRRFASITIHYVEPSGDKVSATTDSSKGDNLMTLAVNNRVDIEGACDGQLACSTCHIVFEQALYDKLQKERPPSEEELDMLDTAFGLTPTSRLGCQIPVDLLPDGTTVTIPSTR